MIPAGCSPERNFRWPTPNDERALEPLGDAVEPGRRLRGEQAPRTHGDDPREDEQPERPEDRERDVAH